MKDSGIADEEQRRRPTRLGPSPSLSCGVAAAGRHLQRRSFSPYWIPVRLRRRSLELSAWRAQRGLREILGRTLNDLSKALG